MISKLYYAQIPICYKLSIYFFYVFKWIIRDIGKKFTILEISFILNS
jgi:hypothetical protein